jgi:opacity protein-like surface antigen
MGGIVCFVDHFFVGPRDGPVSSEKDEAMSSTRSLAAVAAAVLLAIPAASAADLPMMPPMHPVPVDVSGWYLRGDIGFSNQQVKSLFNVLNNAPGTTVRTVDASFDAAPIFGLGVGYQVNNWLRFDVTGEYRGSANFHGLEIVNFNGALSTDEYRARKSEWLAMGNAYVDLGTWWHVTPFIGAGLGASYNKISAFTDINTPNLGVAFAPDTGKWNFAWAVHAGLGYQVSPGLTLQFAYRYLNLGDAQSGDIATFTGVNNIVNPEHFNTITSHDLMFGVRWMMWEPEPLPPPLIRKG